MAPRNSNDLVLFITLKNNRCEIEDLADSRISKLCVVLLTLRGAIVVYGAYGRDKNLRVSLCFTNNIWFCLLWSPVK